MQARNLTKYVENLLEDIVDRIEPSHDSGLPIVFFKEVELPLKKETNVRDEAKRFLRKNLKYLRESSKRSEISQLLFKVFQEKKEISMYDMIEEIYRKTKGITKIAIRKFINILFTGKTFVLAKENTTKSLLNRPLKLNQEIKNPETLEQRYINRILEILRNRFPDLKEEIDMQKILK